MRQTLARLSAEGLAAPYPEPIAGMQLPCGRWLMHLAVHLGFHLGQAGYLRRVVTGDSRTPARCRSRRSPTADARYLSVIRTPVLPRATPSA